MRAFRAAVPALLLASCATAPSRVAPPPALPPGGAQFLYGSGEAVALSRQAYNALVDHVRRRLESERARPAEPRVSVVLAADAMLDQPRTMPCTPAQPRAVVFDMDETLVLNLGYEGFETRRGGSFDAQAWARWEQAGVGQAAAVPGAAWALYELRRMGVTPIINTNRSAAAAGPTAALLKALDLGDFRHGETLFLKGDVDGKSGKDGRRAEIARRYCIVAMAGDQLGDFSDLFTGPSVPARRASAEAPAIWGLWARGWFILPNPLYGTGLAGSWNDVFPPALRWNDPQTKEPN